MYTLLIEQIKNKNNLLVFLGTKCERVNKFWLLVNKQRSNHLCNEM